MTEEEYAAIEPDGRDEYGPAFFKYTEEDHGWSGEIFGRLLWSIYQPRSVIEFGCGAGATSAAIRACGCSVRATDYSLAAGAFVASRDPGIEFVQLDLARPASEISRDLAICVEVLEHLPPEDAPQAVANLSSFAPRVIITACPPTRRTVTRVKAGEKVLHLNEQPFEYWVRLFKKNGMRLNKKATRALQDMMFALSRFGPLPTGGQKQVIPGWYYREQLGVFEVKP